MTCLAAIGCRSAIRINALARLYILDVSNSEKLNVQEILKKIICDIAVVEFPTNKAHLALFFRVTSTLLLFSTEKNMSSLTPILFNKKS